MHSLNCLDTILHFILTSRQVGEKTNLQGFAFCRPCDPHARPGPLKVIKKMLNVNRANKHGWYERLQFKSLHIMSNIKVIVCVACTCKEESCQITGLPMAVTWRPRHPPTPTPHPTPLPVLRVQGPIRQHIKVSKQDHCFRVFCCF